MVALVCTGRLIGYARVSTDDQDLTLQNDSLTSLGLNPDDIFTEKISGAKTDRPELNACLAKLQQGNTLVVWRLDRLGRSMHHLSQSRVELDRPTVPGTPSNASPILPVVGAISVGETGRVDGGDRGAEFSAGKTFSFSAVARQLQPQRGHTQSILHLHTGVSTVYGNLTSLCCTMKRQLHLPSSQSATPLPQAPSRLPQPDFEQHEQPSGMQFGSHWQQ